MTWRNSWIGACIIAALALVFGYAAEAAENVVEGEELTAPWSAELADNVATAVLIGLAAVPFLALRRRSIEQQALLVTTGAQLDEYRARDRESAQVVAARRTRIRGCIVADAVTIVVQPIWNIVGERTLVGYEALARFDDGRTPDTWFGEAQEIGLSKDLELYAAVKALALLPNIPGDAYLSLNVGPETLVSDEFFLLFRDVEAGRCVVELTEHLHIKSYDELQLTLARLRRLGLRIAVDDAGAGFASFRHIIQLAPDIIKLDRDLIRNCNVDPVRRTLAKSLVGFADEIGASIVAEGVETIGELDTLVSMGVSCAQGFYLARPGPLQA